MKKKFLDDTPKLDDTKIQRAYKLPFNGYKLVREKQWELERRVEKLEQIIADIQSRIA